MVKYRSALLSPFILATCVNFAAADFSAILTEAVFNQLAPNAVAPYTYSGFVAAVNSWNTNHPSYPIFSGTESQQRDELAVSQMISNQYILAYVFLHILSTPGILWKYPPRE